MEPVVQEPLGHIKCGDPGRSVLKTVEDKLMLAQALDRQLVAVLQAFLYVVGRQHGIRSHITDILLSKHKDIGVRLEQDTEIAHKSGDSPA